jgi:Ca2+-binding RTX toxin-like protein
LKVIPLLCTFAALAIVCVLQGAVIEQIAYAQMWDFVPDNIKSQNNVNVNGNVIRHTSSSINNNSNGKISIASKCINAISDIRNAKLLSNDTGVSSSFITSKISSNCNPPQHLFNSCKEVGIVTNNREDVIIIPPAQTIRYKNVIKAVSHPTEFPSPETIASGIHTQEICGTNHDDYIIGSEGYDLIFGLRGNDIIMAQGGDDLVFAGLGADIVYGGDGNNQLFGEDGNDNLIGGIGDDLLVGGPGSDRLYGNAGDDILQGGQGADYFDCGDGLDTVVDYAPTQGDVISVDCENVNLIN